MDSHERSLKPGCGGTPLLSSRMQPKKKVNIGRWPLIVGAFLGLLWCWLASGCADCTCQRSHKDGTSTYYHSYVDADCRAECKD